MIDTFEHNGVHVQLQPREIQAGGWKADFTLIESWGMTPYYGHRVYLTSEDARQAAWESARRIIDWSD